MSLPSRHAPFPSRFALLGALALALSPALASPVSADDSRISFRADRMSGSSGKRGSVTTLEGNARVTVGSLTISGERIELSGKDFRYVKASGSVTGEDPEKGFSFGAKQLTYDRETEIASFQGEAKLVDAKNEVECSAGLISYNRKTEVAFLQVDVRLKRRNISCEAGFALYRRELSLLDLTGSPSVVRDGDQFGADRILVNLDTEHITLDGSVTGTLKDTSEKESSANGSPSAESPAGDGPKKTEAPAGAEDPGGSGVPAGADGETREDRT